MALDEVMNDHEQSEQVRSWLKANAPGLIGGVVLGMAVIAGWQWWQSKHLQGSMQASANYSAAVEAIAEGKVAPDKAQAVIAQIDQQNSTLGTLAALELAKSQVDADKPQDAIKTLRGLKNVDGDLGPVVQQRLARLLIDTGKAKEALPLLTDERDAAMLDVRGDAQFALGQRDKAQESYRKALALVDVASPQHRLIAMKLVEAGGTPPHSGEQG
ncbi:MAG: tetratricopeptide repeat protein [Thermomonas sp.]|uniref:YfgM family protein n=1 Tax=Thermomonas sp. TaxID=1971895 RepID=UPI001EBB1B02|nr:tetratricopeptide repeat protein [Thermomonas sp.]MBV2209956.1 tetratricopeptide repeat protein [Thermomonas sp.]